MTVRKQGPPRFSRKLLDRLAHSGERATIAGDLDEYYFELENLRGRASARLWFRLQVLRTVPKLLIFSMKWSLIMLRNHLKLALRALVRRKGFSLLNLTGLSLGLASCILILLWIQGEMAYDRFHENRDHLFLTYMEAASQDGQERRSDASFFPLAAVLKEECPGTIEATRFQVESGLLLRQGERASSDDRIGFVDPDFLGMFSFPFLKGDPKAALQDLNSVILTRTAAEKYFGEEDPLGRVINIEGQFDVKVTGILEDIPVDSSLRFDMLCPFPLLFGPGGKEPSHWGGNPLRTYVRLQENMIPSEYEAGMTGAVKRHMGQLPPDITMRMRLHRLSRMHLHALGGGGLIVYISIFSVIAAFVLGIACINFMNLTTARAAGRANEVGMRKVVGARRSDLVRQFMGEAVVLALAAFGVSLGLASLALPLFNRLAATRLSIGMLGHVHVLPWLLTVLVGTAVFSGVYPSLYLSAFQPARVMRSSRGSGEGRSVFRRILVVGQFAISTFLIIATIFIHRQLIFMQSKDLGYDRDQLVTMRLHGDFETLRLRFLQHPAVRHVTASCQNPLWITSTHGQLDWEGKDPDLSVTMNWDFVDYDYLETLGMEIVEGRAFSRDFATDVDHAYILNQEAVRVMGVESPVGKSFSLMGTEGTVIGIVKDFHFRSLHNPIQPLVLGVRPNWLRLVMARIQPGQTAPALAHLESVWEEINPDRPFQYDFLDERINILYRSEQRMSSLFDLFTGLAIIISCLGIFGLAAYMAERRTKEIGIRKVLGASASGIVGLLSRDFSRWVLLANLIAWPAAWLAARRWLQGFAYRVPLDPWVFVLAAAAALGLALLTAGGQAIRAAHADPSRTLRCE